MIEFDWKVIDIVNDETLRGATVTYIPIGEGSEQTKFVPIPWQKAVDTAHARQIMENKIRAYAPTREWEKERNPAPDNPTETIVEDLKTETHTGEQRESKPDTEGSGDSASIPESSGSEGK